MIHVPAWTPLVTEADVTLFGEAGQCFGCSAPIGQPHAATGTVECWKLRHRRDKRHAWIAYLHLKAKGEETDHAVAGAAMTERDVLIEELQSHLEYERPTLLGWIEHHREHTMARAA